jgi:hypothetical protein
MKSGYIWSDPDDFSRGFMARSDGKRCRREVSVNDMNVSSTEAAGMYLHENLARAQDGNICLDHGEIVWAVENQGSHCTPSM